MVKQYTKQLIDDNQEQAPPEQIVQRSKNIELLCLSDERLDDQTIRPEILAIAQLLARVAVDSYIQTVTSAKQNL